MVNKHFHKNIPSRTEPPPPETFLPLPAGGGDGDGRRPPTKPGLWSPAEVGGRRGASTARAEAQAQPAARSSEGCEIRISPQHLK